MVSTRKNIIQIEISCFFSNLTSSQEYELILDLLGLRNEKVILGLVLDKEVVRFYPAKNKTA